MISITNSKIDGFLPVFQSFKGFSCLFDHIVEDEILYSLIHSALQEIEPKSLMNTYLFCPLPLSSYHITVWDGINEGNLDSINSKYQPYFRDFLKGINSPQELVNPFKEFLESSALINEKTWNIRLKFKELVLWVNAPVLVVALEAVDKESKNNLIKLEKERAKLNQVFEEVLGIKMFRDYVPHNTIGYFANKEGAIKALDQLGKWNEIFNRTLKDVTIQCNSASLYGFDDMTNFFNAQNPNKIQYLPSSSDDLLHIRRLMNMHDFYRTIPDFYKGELNREAIKKMRSGTYAPNPEKTIRLQESYHTSLIIKLSSHDGKVIFQKIRKVFDEIETLIRNFYPKTNPEIYFDSAHITIRSLIQYREQSIDELKKYRNVLYPKIKKWVERFSDDTTLYIKGLHVSLNSFKGLSIGIRVYPSTPMIQMLRGVAGNTLYDAMEKDILKPEDLWEEIHCATWHTKLTHATFLRERSSELLPSWNSSVMPEREGEFIEKFETIIEKYENEVFGRISNIQLEDIFIRNGRSDKMLVGDGGGVEISMRS